MLLEKNTSQSITEESPAAELRERALAAVRSYYANVPDSFTTFAGFWDRVALGFYLLLNRLGLVFITNSLLSALMQFWFDGLGKRNAVETCYTAFSEPEKLDAVRKLLADEESKQVFDWLIQYRIALAMGSDAIAARIFPLPGKAQAQEKPLAQTLKDNFVLKTYRCRHYAVKTHGDTFREAWLDEVYSLGKRCEVNPGDVVIDAGAFYGETAVWFADRAGESGRVFTFDPSSQFTHILRRNIERNDMGKRIEVVQKGLWDESKRLYLKSLSAGSYCSEESGEQSIEVVTIDSFVDSMKLARLDFIKMDIEGAELRALRGAEKSIKRFKPKLAISVYHRASDLYEIPELLKAFVPEYKLYLSQKTTSWDGTTLFASV